ncbi:MAG: lysine--tRNA ligase [Candidatus Nanoarchaeia archaeon]|nr:lysine--tRNA ligase [Candidatus Nanoarchaeia archaeon]
MIDDYINERLKKLEKIKAMGINPYPQIVLSDKKSSVELLKKYAEIGEEKSKNVEEYAGRIMSFRSMGNIAFVNLQDEYGKVQIVFQSKETKNYELLKLLDLGDLIVVKGNFFKTKKGEISINATNLTLASKSIRPLPEKFHGLKDEETIFRKRYLDAIMNPEVLELYKKKSRIIKLMKNFMDSKGFLEVQTPILQNVYGGASAEPFITHYNALDTDFYLRISPELHLKRMIVAGYNKIYEIGPTFRNEGMDASHLQEISNHFEFYWTYQDYEGLMKFTEELLTKIILEANNSLIIKYGDASFDFKTPFARITFKDLLIKYSGIDIDKFNTFDLLKKEILKKGLKEVNVNKCSHYGALLDELYKRTARPNVMQPTFLLDYPVEMIPLAKRKENDSSKISSFQLLVNGWELTKAYNELNDPVDQENRLVEQQGLLKSGDKEAHPLDNDFIEAMQYGMPPIAGFGLGLDRFIALLLNIQNIRATAFFPTLKPVND